MNINLETKIQTRIIDAATRNVLRESAPQKNLIMDGALNALAKSTNATFLAEMFAACRVGSGTTPNKFASGAVTFTQAGTTITASAGFFTGSMVGMLFKYGSGSGGAEYYITGYTSSTIVTVDTSATVAVPNVATVWAVAQSGLDTLLYSTASYETAAGSCGTTYSTNSVTFKRTFNFAQQVGSYNVNEIGYFRATTGSTIFGRLLLGATDVVPPTSFYQVTLSITATFSPGAPLAVANVGTNIDTAGNAMLEFINENSSALASVATTGATNPESLLDNPASGNNRAQLFLITATYSQNGTTGTSFTITQQATANVATWVFGGTRGKKTLTFGTTITTAGETLYGIGIGTLINSKVCFDVKLTSTYVMPVGSFLPQAVFSLTYDRTLTN